MVYGATTCIENRFTAQPRPNGPHASRCELVRPQLVSVSRVHSPARLQLGEPVRRWPITSHNCESVSMTLEGSRPPCRMRSIVASGCVAGTAAIDCAVLGASAATPDAPLPLGVLPCPAHEKFSAAIPTSDKAIHPKVLV